MRHLLVRMEQLVRLPRMVTAVSHVLQDGKAQIVMKVCCTSISFVRLNSFAKKLVNVLKLVTFRTCKKYFSLFLKGGMV